MGINIIKHYMQNSRFYKYYKYIVSEDLILAFNLNNVMQLPKVKKVTLNTNSKLYLLDKKAIARAFGALYLIAAQKSQTTLARNSIAAFKLRKGTILGCKISLRRVKMYAFLEKLITFVLPRLRQSNLQGKASFENFGNINLGVSNLLLFHELEPFFSFFDPLQGIDIAMSISWHKTKSYRFTSSNKQKKTHNKYAFHQETASKLCIKKYQTDMRIHHFAVFVSAFQYPRSL